MAELGLTTSDGTCPFVLADPYASPAGPTIADPLFPHHALFESHGVTRGPRQLDPSSLFPDDPATDRLCRALTGQQNERCTMFAVFDTLCPQHCTRQ